MTVEAAGVYGAIQGRISGRLNLFSSLSLASETRGAVAEIEPNSSGYYSISYLPPGEYWLTVNAGKNSTVSPAEQVKITVQANERVAQNYSVE